MLSISEITIINPLNKIRLIARNPIEVLQHLMAFLDVKSLVRLHTACSANVADKNFINQAFHGFMIKDIMVNDLSFQWMKNRNIDIDHATSLHLVGWTKFTFQYLEIMQYDCKSLSLSNINVKKIGKIFDCREIEISNILTELSITDCIGRHMTYDYHLGNILETVPRLQKLTIDSSFQMTSNGFRNIFSSLKFLKELDLFNCCSLMYLSDKNFKNFVNKTRNLESLQLKSFSDVEHGFNNIIERSVRLKKINFKGCTRLNNSTLFEISNTCYNLKSLHVESCRKITNKGLISIAKNCPDLEHLNISQLKQVTDEILFAFSEQSKQLKTIDISCCPKITDEGFMAIINTHTVSLHGVDRNLKGINISGCDEITDNGLEAIFKMNTSIEDLIVCCKPSGKITVAGLFSIIVNCNLLKTLQIENDDGLSELEIKDILNLRPLLQITIKRKNLKMNEYRYYGRWK
jgi:hypothetical protein